ncbi:MAG: YcaO-like family protein [Candidatus Paceibacterota bacterium]|jgi:ribosomal protein S12 methylthiotransferase accessory factor
MKRGLPAREVREDRQEFSSFERAFSKWKSNVLAGFVCPCGRFKSVLSLGKALSIKLAKSIEHSAFLGGASPTSSQEIPANWQALLEYLHKKEIIEAPRFYTYTSPSDGRKENLLLLLARDITHKTDGRKVDPHGFGTASSLEEAMSKAVGEVLERYFLTLYRRETFSTSSCASLLKEKKHFLDPVSLNSFLPWQKEASPDFLWNSDTLFCWVKGEELIGKETVHIPAQLVYWNYRCEEGEPLLVGPTTSGSAGHFSRSEAILASLLENIERDGFLIYWLNSLSPNIIDVSLVEDEEVKELLAYIQHYRLEVFFLNITTDIGIPSCICAIVDRTGDTSSISLGGAAGFDLTELIMHSASEALSIHASADKEEGYVLPEPYAPFTDATIRKKKRLHVWKGRKMYERFKFFISGKKQDPASFMQGVDRFRSSEERLGYIYTRFAELGEEYKIYCYEVKDAVLSALGYHVVRTIVPPLVPLYLNERFATLDAKRLRDVPHKLGYTPTGNMNPWPHPFS